MQFPYRYSTSEVFSLAEAYFPWEILQKKWTILAFPTGLRYCCSSTWAQWCVHLSGRRQLPQTQRGLTPQELHHFKLKTALFIQTGSKPHILFCILCSQEEGWWYTWWCPEHGLCSIAVSRLSWAGWSSQARARSPPQAGQLELQVLLCVAFLAAFFKHSL